MYLLAQKMTPPTTPYLERAPWALVIGGEPLSSGWMNHIELTTGNRQNKYEHAHHPCQPQKYAQTLETTT